MLDNSYFRLLKVSGLKRGKRRSDPGIQEEKWTERKWNGPRQFQDSSGKLMMLPSDLALIQDPAFAKWVDLYAEVRCLSFFLCPCAGDLENVEMHSLVLFCHLSFVLVCLLSSRFCFVVVFQGCFCLAQDEDRFHADFAHAWTKLMELGVEFQPKPVFTKLFG